MAGLTKKLGIKSGQVVCLLNAPTEAAALLRQECREKVSFYDTLERGPYDVIMFCDIGPIQKNLLNLAHKRLPPEGMIVLVDRFLSEDGTEPLNRILSQLAGSDFNVKTKEEVAKILRSSRFKKIKIHKIHKDVWTITARKLKK